MRFILLIKVKLIEEKAYGNYAERRSIMIPFISDIAMMAVRENNLGVLSTSNCGCYSSSSNCGNNNFSSTGSNVASQCGANYIAMDNPVYTQSS